MQLADDAAQGGATPHSSSAEAFEFVKSLAAELSSSKIDLPSFPDIAVRVQRVLADENVAHERVVRVLGGEPTLAAKIMSMANSAALNPSGRQISDLKNAVTRLGFDMLRSAAITFAMAQLRKASQYKSIENGLNEIWQRSVAVAASSFVIAKRRTRMPPDTAMLAGLLHGIGKLYILTRASKFPALFADAAAYNGIVEQWHLNIAKALLENWQISDVVVEAVYQHEDLARDTRGPAELADVLAAGCAFASFQDQPALLSVELSAFGAEQRLGLDPETCEKLLAESADEIAALRDALGS